MLGRLCGMSEWAEDVGLGEGGRATGPGELGWGFRDGPRCVHRPAGLGLAKRSGVWMPV